jgi:aspartyl-tRNA(Asn)/glutamyl-tRNA(Gln) amidotransferase subunit C
MFIKELETVAFLAKIEIKNEEKERYFNDIDKMFDYIKILQEPDVNGLEPTTHVTKLRNVWRFDVVKPCTEEIVDMMLESSPEREESFYKIKKVIIDY